MSSESKGGLEDVVVSTSDICFIDGREGRLVYRGFDVNDLVEHSSFEEVVYLLWYGGLPSRKEWDAHRKALSATATRNLPPKFVAILRALPKKTPPMEVLRTGVSALSAFDPETADKSPEATLRKGIRLTAQVPLIVCAHEHIRNGREPVAPNPKLGHAANFLYMLKGKEPGAEAARLMEIDMVLHAEHGSNASSFAARVVAGTDADLHGAITAAVAALAGPAHGGAAENVMRMAQEIGDASRAAQYVKDKRANNEPVMGFGHRVYRAEDPRARHMRAGVEKLSREMGQPHWYRILEGVVEAMKPYARHGVNVNVDFYAGVVYFLNGIAEDLFVPIFAVGRVPGWTVQVLEQLENNILLRPLTLYNGPEPREYVPIDAR